MYLRTKADYFLIPYLLFGLYTRVEVCLLRGRKWTFKYRSGLTIPQGEGSMTKNLKLLKQQSRHQRTQPRRLCYYRQAWSELDRRGVWNCTLYTENISQKKKITYLYCRGKKSNRNYVCHNGVLLGSSIVRMSSYPVPPTCIPRLLMVCTLYILACTIRYDVIAR